MRPVSRTKNFNIDNKNSGININILRAEFRYLKLLIRHLYEAFMRANIKKASEKTRIINSNLIRRLLLTLRHVHS